MAEIHTGDQLTDMIINQKKGEEAHIKELFLTYVKLSIVDETWKFEQAMHKVIQEQIQTHYFNQGHHIAINYVREFMNQTEIQYIIR